MHDEKLRFAVTVGTELDPQEFQATGHRLVVHRDFPGRCNSIVLVNAANDEIAMELPQCSPGTITARVKEAHRWWLNGYAHGASDALLNLHRALGLQP